MYIVVYLVEMFSATHKKIKNFQKFIIFRVLPVSSFMGGRHIQVERAHIESGTWRIWRSEGRCFQGSVQGSVQLWDPVADWEVVGMPWKCVPTGVFRRLSMNAGKEASGETSIVGLLLLLFG